jgi:hypothetical protein
MLFSRGSVNTQGIYPYSLNCSRTNKIQSNVSMCFTVGELMVLNMVVIPIITIVHRKIQPLILDVSQMAQVKI